MKMRKWISIVLAAAVLLMLAGCGAGSELKTESAVNSSFNRAPEIGYDSSLDMEYGSMQEVPAAGESQASVPQGRKWIVTIDMQAETEDLDALLEQINQRIAELDGYVEDQNIYNGSAYSSRRYRYANLTIRVPADRVDDFTAQVESISNVVSHNKRLDDVTLSYVATESRMKALQAEEARLLELMGKAETMSDLLEIESRLTDVRYELESVTSQLRVYDNLVDYATIDLNIEEVQEYTPVVEETLWQRISGGFMDSLKGLGNFFVELFVFLIVSLPYLVLIGGIIALIVFLCKRSAKKHRAKRAACPPPVYPPQPAYPPQNYPNTPPAQQNKPE